jgi:pSer/pThr/pTyr-binding forkhead associated (FHA) protein
MTFVLVSARGRKQGLKIPIKQEVFLIGSSPRSQIRSVKDGVGHQHCAIVVRKHKLYIQDLSSGHPTRVNGTTLAAGARQRLQVGDRVALGPMEFIVKVRKKKSPRPLPTPIPLTQPVSRPPTFAAPATAPRPAPRRILSSVRLVMALVALALICVGIGWLVFQPSADKDKGSNTEGTNSGEERQTAATKGAGKPDGAARDKKEPERRSEPKPPLPAKPAQQKQPEPAPKPATKPEPPPMPKPEPKAPVKQDPPPPPPPPKPKPAEGSKPLVSFTQHVLPIFQARCVLCHNAAKQRGGLDVTTVAALLKGGDNGPALVPGSLDKGTLWESIDTDQMPKVGEKLTAAEKKIIRDWILSAKKSP